jgi:hypothetical protein
VGTAVLLAGLAGCSPSTHVVPLTKAEKSLTSIVLAYKEAHKQLGRAPKSADELKPFLKEFGDPGELLVSPNDGQPFVVVWGVDPTRGGPIGYKGMWQIIAYDQKGTGGRRAVTDIRGRPMTVPEEDFQKLTFVGQHKPSS